MDIYHFDLIRGAPNLRIRPNFIWKFARTIRFGQIWFRNAQPNQASAEPNLKSLYRIVRPNHNIYDGSLPNHFQNLICNFSYILEQWSKQFSNRLCPVRCTIKGNNSEKQNFGSTLSLLVLFHPFSESFEFESSHSRKKAHL